MAIAVRAVGAIASGAATINPGLPAGFAADDIHVLIIETSNEPVAAMSGWNNVGAGSINIATGTVTSLTVRWRRAVGGDTAPTVPDSGDHQIARIIGFSGCVTAGDPWDVTLFGTDTSTSTTISFPNPPNTTQANDMVVHALATGQDTATGQVSGNGTNAALTGLANRVNNWAIIQGGGGIAAITGLKATAGSIGVTTVPITTGTNPKALFTGALKEAAAAAGIPSLVTAR